MKGWGRCEGLGGSGGSPSATSAGGMAGSPALGAPARASAPWSSSHTPPCSPWGDKGRRSVTLARPSILQGVIISSRRGRGHQICISKVEVIGGKSDERKWKRKR